MGEGGSEGPRLYEWARGCLPYWTEYGYAQWLSVRCSVDSHDPEEKLAWYRAHGPQQRLLAKLVQVAGRRWSIEECFAQAKGAAGLD